VIERVGVGSHTLDPGRGEGESVELFPGREKGCHGGGGEWFEGTENEGGREVTRRTRGANFK